MKNLLLLVGSLSLVGVLGFFGCEKYKPGEEAKEHVPCLVYIRDTRTHLCFATMELGRQDGVLATVPCSDEVMQQIYYQYKREHRDE